jgi:hypothetical protein
MLGLCQVQKVNLRRACSQAFDGHCASGRLRLSGRKTATDHEGAHGHRMLQSGARYVE